MLKTKRRSAFILLFALLVATSSLIAETCEPLDRMHSAIDPQPQDWSQWRNKHRQYCETSKRNTPRLVFLGNSIVESWPTVGQQVWDRYYASRQAANFGISGDRTQHLLWRINNGLFEQHSPEAIVVLIGTNNIKEQRNTAEETAEGVEAVAASLVRHVPNTQILLLGILPCGQTADSQPRCDAAFVNQRLAKTLDHKRITYLDISDRLIQADGTISQSVMSDYLHLTEHGYEILASAMEPVLAGILNSSASAAQQ